MPTLKERNAALCSAASPSSGKSEAGNHAEANLSALIESTQDLIWSVDLNLGLLTFNRALQRHIERNFGTQAAIGKRPEDLLPPARAELWPPLFERALTQGPFRIEVPFPDGRTLEMAFNPIVVESKVAGISIFGKDITERKRAEEELHESRDSLKEAQIIGGLGSYVLDVPTGVWTSSDVLDGLLGINAEYDRTVAGWTELIHPDDRAMMAVYFAIEIVGRGKAFDKEYRIIRHSDHAVRWVQGMGRLEFDGKGQPLRMRGVIKDITEHKLSEIQLQESESRFRRFFEENGSVMFILDPSSGEIFDANQAAAAYYGYAREELIRMPISQINSLPAEEVALEQQRAMREERNRFNFRHRLASGEERDVEVYSSPMRVGGRQLLFSIVHDVSERRRTEMQLRDSEERYRATFEQAAVGIVHTSFDGRFLRWNARFAEIIGYPQEEISGLNFQWITAPDDLAPSVEVLRQMAGCAIDSANWEKRYVRKDGSLTWVKVAVSAQRDGQGRALHYIALVEDINALKEAQEALRASESRYRIAFQTSQDAVNINRLDDGKYIECNKAFIDIIGFSREEIIGHTSLELGIWVDHRDRQKMVEILRQGSSCRDLEAQFKRKNGEVFWGLMSASAIEIDGVPCLLSISRDISDAKAAEQRLAAAAEAQRVSEERYRTVFQTSLDPILISRVDNRQYIDVNQAFLDVMGFEREEVLGRTSLELNLWTEPIDGENFFEILSRTSECRNLEIQFRKKNGETVWGLMSASVVEIDGIRCVLAIARDVSNAKAAEDEIRNLAFYDSLTGLPNRRLLLERLRQTLTVSIRSSRKKALLFVDLDNFKTLNDTLGHQTGDLLLQEAARRLTNCIGKADTVARLGGDEFLVMLEDLSEAPEDAAAQAEAVGEKILAAVEQPYWLDGHECRSSASIGITVLGERRETSNEVLKQADIAMYQAKTAGRNTIRFFAPALQAAVDARAALEEDLRQAIKSDQFMLCYQPQVDRGQVTGAEALIRWEHPKRGLLAPGEFIPLAEETGLILPLGDWVLETACKQIALWANRNETAHLTVAVNISARQLRQPDFVERVLSALNRTRANPQNLKLELTESMLVENIEDVIAKMTDLKAHGLRFSLDDFGTGYSSLAYLKRLPLDQLKIDRSFVRDILADVSSRAIAQAVVSLGRAMGLTVIAEGVETEGQRDYLDRLGCHSFQGFLFSRPLTLEHFERLWLGFAERADPLPR